MYPLGRKRGKKKRGFFYFESFLKKSAVSECSYVSQLPFAEGVLHLTGNFGLGLYLHFLGREYLGAPSLFLVYLVVTPSLLTMYRLKIVRRVALNLTCIPHNKQRGYIAKGLVCRVCRVMDGGPSSFELNLPSVYHRPPPELF